MRSRRILPIAVAPLAVLLCFAGRGLAGETPSAEQGTPGIAIDASKTGEPISKYIYSQFIEHLGRCIYGGIWAEMLEDRKFYHPVSDQYAPYRRGRRGGGAAARGQRGGEVRFPVVSASPWQVMGEAGSVTMVKEGSFVGDHTPQVASGSGIRQRDLGVVKSKEYVGYVWLKPVEKAAEVEVALRWGEEADQVTSTKISVRGTEYAKSDFRFTAGADTDQAMLEIRVTGGGAPSGFCLVGTASLMPADNIDGMRADTIALLKELNSPLYRWPGGNFVSGYNWKDGIGPRDRRPPRTNPAWTGVEHNDVGIHEFINFCRVVGAEPEVVVNSGLGTVDAALEELQYANGAADTPMGKLRAKNGHPEPLKVVWWAIGNEMYGNWQLGHMPQEEYMKKHNQFADAMRAEDPAIKLIAVGDAGSRWSANMMQNCADHMDLISEHFYVRERPDLVAHIRQVPASIRRIAQAHRGYREQYDELEDKDIRISLDEWNYWYGPHVFGELGTRYFLKDGLGIAAGVHEYARQSDIVFMANYAQTVNVIGCIKTSKTAAAFETTGLVLKLYRNRFGVIPVDVTASQPLDVAAAWTEDRKTLTIGVVNPTTQKMEIPLVVKGAKLSGSGKRWQIAGDDPQAYNDPDEEPQVTIEESSVSGVSDKLSVAPLSATVFALTVE